MIVRKYFFTEDSISPLKSVVTCAQIGIIGPSHKWSVLSGRFYPVNTLLSKFQLTYLHFNEIITFFS